MVKAGDRFLSCQLAVFFSFFLLGPASPHPAKHFPSFPSFSSYFPLFLFLYRAMQPTPADRILTRVKLFLNALSTKMRFKQ